MMIVSLQKKMEQLGEMTVGVDFIQKRRAYGRSFGEERSIRITSDTCLTKCGTILKATPMLHHTGYVECYVAKGDDTYSTTIIHPSFCEEIN